MASGVEAVPASSRHHCPMCSDFSTPTAKLLLGHLSRVHSHSPNFSFTCGLDGCLTTCKSYSSLRKHIQRKHKSSLFNQENEPSRSNQSFENDEDGHTQSGYDHEWLDPDVGGAGPRDYEIAEDQHLFQLNSARWIMKLKEVRKLTQQSVNCILGDVTDLCDDIVTRMQRDITLRLQSAGITPADVPGLSDLLDSSTPLCRPFDGLDTYYRQVAFMKKHLKLVEPVEVELGVKYVWKGSGLTRRMVQKKDTFSYVPILAVLERMLQNSSIFQEVATDHRHDDALLEDFCDGIKGRTHMLFSTRSLQLIMYFDELEVCNPIGSVRKKHKLGLFYFVLGNIHPRYRSSLKAIQLVAICKNEYLKTYGIFTVMQHFVKDIKKLEQGVTMNTAEGPMHMRGSIASFVGDNLGSQAIGGFKEGGSALRPCRHCMITRTELSSKMSEKDLQLRSPNNYDHTCNLLDSLDDPYHTTTYGINQRSCLNELTYYHVSDYGLPPDVMHDVLEGYLPYTLKLLLSYYITTLKLFSIEDLNEAIENMDYGHAVSSRPQRLSISDLSTQSGCAKFLLSAAETWVFARLLPIMIGHRVPHEEPHWVHFLQLLDIMEILFAPVLEENVPATLLVSIESNLRTFVTLYPTSTVIPKMHYLLHLPRFIENIGPLVRHWTMRFEAKHQYFKSLANSMGNFINISHSLAMRHQTYQCYILQDEDLLKDSIECGPGKSITLSMTEFGEDLAKLLPVTPSSLFRAKWVKFNGMHLKPGVVVVLSPYVQSTESPEFGSILEVFMLPCQGVFLGVKVYEVSDYNEHLHAWGVRCTDTNRALNVKSLCSPQLLHARTCHCSLGIEKFISLKHSIVHA